MFYVLRHIVPGLRWTAVVRGPAWPFSHIELTLAAGSHVLEGFTVDMPDLPSLPDDGSIAI
jgi:hypothetical protein